MLSLEHTERTKVEPSCRQEITTVVAGGDDLSKNTPSTLTHPTTIALLRCSFNNPS